MITIPIWVLILLIILALGSISITIGKPEKKEKPAEPEIKIVYVETKDVNYDDAFRMICIDEEKQIYVSAVELQQMAYAYYAREWNASLKENVLRPRPYREGKDPLISNSFVLGSSIIVEQHDTSQEEE